MSLGSPKKNLQLSTGDSGNSIKTPSPHAKQPNGWWMRQVLLHMVVHHSFQLDQLQEHSSLRGAHMSAEIWSTIASSVVPDIFSSITIFFPVSCLSSVTPNAKIFPGVCAYAG